MTTELIMAIAGFVATTLATLLTAWLTRSKYTTEIAKLRADVAAANADASHKELENVKFGNEIIMENIVKPLEGHVKRLNKNVAKLEKAIARIPACPHSGECPVSLELLNNEEGDDGEPADGK